MLGEVKPGEEPKFGRNRHFSAGLVRFKTSSPLPALGQRGSTLLCYFFFFIYCLLCPLFLFSIIPSFHYSNSPLLQYSDLPTPSPKRAG